MSAPAPLIPITVLGFDVQRGTASHIRRHCLSFFLFANIQIVLLNGTHCREGKTQVNAPFAVVPWVWLRLCGVV